MDWPKAKNILIVCFLIVNLLLVTRLYIIPQLDIAVRPVSREAIIRVLEMNDVRLASSLPRRTSTAPFARVSIRSYTAKEIADLALKILGPSGVRVTPNDQPSEDHPVTFMLGTDELVVVTGRGYISYQNRAVQPSSVQLSEQEARRLAEEFFRERLGGPRDFTFDSTTVMDTDIQSKSYRIDYVQKHRDSYVFPGYIMIVVKPGGVAAMWMCRLNVSYEPGTAKRTLSATEAVLSLLNYRHNAGDHSEMTVFGADFGYHSPIYDSVDPSWRAVPIWRIKTSLGDYYINAHSGVPEVK